MLHGFLKKKNYIFFYYLFQPYKHTKRKNAWGNQSYAEIICRAIESSRDKRLTLSQIYKWIVDNIPYFAGEVECRSSKDWKVRCDVIMIISNTVNKY